MAGGGCADRPRICDRGGSLGSPHLGQRGAAAEVPRGRPLSRMMLYLGVAELNDQARGLVRLAKNNPSPPVSSNKPVVGSGTNTPSKLVSTPAKKETSPGVDA